MIGYIGAVIIIAAVVVPIGIVIAGKIITSRRDRQ